MRGVSAAEMLRGLNLGSNTMSMLLHGRAPSVITVARIADYLGVSVDYLLGRVSSPMEYYTPAGIARNISAACKQRGVSCAEMCACLNLPDDTCDGMREISARALAKIADYLKITTDELVGR